MALLGAILTAPNNTITPNELILKIPMERNIEYLCLKFITHSVAVAVYLT